MTPRPASRVPAFTFIELLVAMAIGMVIMGVLMVMFMVSRSSYMSADASIVVQEQVRRAYDAMVKELREAGNVNGAGGLDATNVERLDFQVAQSYDTNAPPDGCSGICWGNSAGTGGWVHYVVNGGLLYRCESDGQGDAIADYSACRVLATNVQTFAADYSKVDWTVTMRLETRTTSAQLATGSLSITPAPLTTSVRLRNDS